MVGAGGLLEAAEMAGDALRRKARVHAAGMALRTLRVHVRAAQRELCHGVVIELYAQPGSGAVADRTLLGEPRRLVVGICGRVKVLKVASDASRSRSAEVVVGMAGGAFQPRMRSGESEAREPGMVELRAQPAVHGMALLAVGGISNGGVAGIICLRIVGGMARITCRGEAHELSGGRALVAGVTGQRGVGANQRKAILVLLYVLDGNLPPFYGVALFTFRAHLPAMDVGVAVGAFVPHVGKDHLDVTLGAGDRCVHAAQGVCSLAVVKVGDGPNGLPAQAGMA